ncbi:MAG: HEAT repeat domain-containing protein [Brevundimonas sp.]
MVQALGDSEWDVRAEACVAAGRIGSPSFAEPLACALSDREWWVRFRAAEALSAMGVLGRETLMIAAASPVDVTRRSASLALAELGLA